MRIVVFCATYPPASRGGTVRAIEGLVARLGGEWDFHVFTRDRGDGETVPYVGITTGGWQRAGSATVYYASPAELSAHRMASVVRAVDADGYYVNSLMSPTFGILPVMLRWLGAIPHHPMIIAPRGELHPGALQFKHRKKTAFIALARRLPGYADLIWQAGNETEARHILGCFPGARVATARDLSTLVAPTPRERPKKIRGELRLVYLSRITPIKNLLAALRIVSGLQGAVHFDVYGPIVEQEYFEECRRLVGTMPPNVRVRFEGEVPHERVLEVLSAYHAFLLPTFGESFGHAILEALLAGLVTVISDQTPWRDLANARAGWDIPLSDEEQFARALQACVEMDDGEFLRAARAAQQIGVSALTNNESLEENRQLLARLIGGHEPDRYS